MLKLPEVAQRLGVSEKTARRYIKAGAIPSVFIGNAYRVREEDLEEYVRQAQVEPEDVGIPKVAAPPLLDEFLEERCGHAYIARSKDGVEALINDADPLLVDGIMDQIRQEITVLGEERKKYPAVGRWRWEESFTDLMSKYLLAGFAATERSPARREAALKMAAELEHPPTRDSEVG